MMKNNKQLEPNITEHNFETTIGCFLIKATDEHLVYLDFISPTKLKTTTTLKHPILKDAEKQLKEYGDKIPAEKKGAIESAVKELKMAHAAKDFAKIEVNLKTLNDENFKQIFDAIDKGYTLVVLPETAFSVALNKYPSLNNMLLELSNKIDIVTGALYVEDNQIFNASYFYSKNSVTVAKKVVLVPFGEEIPLPKFFVDLINDIFYNGATDYSKASSPTDFIIQGEKYRNAICYEGTTDKIFENLGDTKYMIMISNNAWFTPSIEPTLQHLLLKYYSKKYSVTIFHVVNGSENRIYRP